MLLSAAVASTMGLVAGCAFDAYEATEAWKRWDSAGVRDYSFHLRSGCSDDDGTGKYDVPRGRFAVTVRDRQVETVRALDEAGRTAVERGDADSVPSISALFDMLQDATADHADTVVMRFSEVDGHPTRLVVDDLDNQRGDKNCFAVTAYRPE